jgi:male-specific lethal 1
VRDDCELYQLITKLNAENSNKYVKKYGQGIVWSIEKFDEKNKNKDLTTKKTHIMISYNRNSRDICLRIKAELERLGHLVWIDVENIHGSTLEAMANAIEESKCVLICMTEDYKQSVYCRAVNK